MTHRISLCLFLCVLAADSVSAAVVPLTDVASVAGTQSTNEEANSARPGLTPWNWPTTPALLEIAAALRASRTNATGDNSVLVDRIAKVCAKDVAAAVEILVRARVPEASAEDGPQVLSVPQRGLLLGALGRSNPASIRAEFERRLLDEPTPELRRAFVHALGAIGRGADVERLALLAPRRADGSLDRATKEALRAAATSIFRRDPSAIRAAAHVLTRVPPDAGQELVFGLGSRRDPLLLPQLATIAGVSPKLAPLCVSLVRAVGPSSDAAIDSAFCAWMVDELARARPEYKGMLLQALGELDEGSNLAAIVAELGAAELGVRDSANWALKKITGLAFAPEPRAWKAFLAEDQAWMTRERPKLAQAIRSGSLERAADALRDYGDRHTHKALLVADVLLALERTEVGLRRLACEILGHLATPASIEPLCNLLDDPDPIVSEAAWKALNTLRGVDLPRDRADARIALGLP